MYDRWEYRHKWHGHRHGFRWFPWPALLLGFLFLAAFSGSAHHGVFWIFGWPLLFAVPFMLIAPFVALAWFAAPHMKRWWNENGRFQYQDWSDKRKNDDYSRFDSLFEDEKPKRGAASGDDTHFYV